MQACKSPLGRKSSLSQRSWNTGRSKRLWLADSTPTHLRWESFLGRSWKLHAGTSPQPFLGRIRLHEEHIPLPSQDRIPGSGSCTVTWVDIRLDTRKTGKEDPAAWSWEGWRVEVSTTSLPSSLRLVSWWAWSFSCVLVSCLGQTGLSLLSSLLSWWDCLQAATEATTTLLDPLVAVDSKQRPALLDTVG